MTPIGLSIADFCPMPPVETRGQRITDSDGDDSFGLMPKMDFR
jgi:hypothetical protein